MNYYLDSFEFTMFDETTTYDYEDEWWEGSEVLGVFRITGILFYLSLVGVIIGLVGAALVMTQKMNNKVGAIFVLIALILALMAPFYLMFMLPGAFENEFEEFGSDGYLPTCITKGFFGSEEKNMEGVHSEYSWGGGMGWFFALIAFVLILIALLLVGMSSPRPIPIAPQQPPAQQPYPPQGPSPSQPPSPPPQEPSYPIQ
jgi:hypothetical protein